MTRDDDALPAILGGRPVRPAGPPNWPPRDPATDRVLERLAASGDWGRYAGEHGPKLVEALRDLHGVEHVRLCASGTAAVALALHGLGVSAGDEVILAAYDFKSNFMNVLALGAVPVLVDIEPDSRQMDVGQVEQAIRPKTRCVLVSHLHGSVVDMPALRGLGARHGLPILEDACQMPGAVLWEKPAGTWGDVGVISFGGSKTLSAGRGGAVYTSRADVAQRIKLYVERGNDLSPLSEMQAAILLPQVELLEERRRVRQRNVQYLLDGLARNGTTTSPERDRTSLLYKPTVAPGLRAFAVADEADVDYYKLGFVYDPIAWHGLPRQGFVKAMQAEGIAVNAGFAGLHKTHSQRRFRAVSDLPVASSAHWDTLVLHHPVLIEGEEAMADILAAVRKMQAHAAAIRDTVELHPEDEFWSPPTE